MRPARLLLLSVLVLVSCSDDNDKNRDGGTKYEGGGSDHFICHQPPGIEDCFPPPNNFSTTRWFCGECGYCGGGPPTAACNDFTDDCRIFYDTCIPKTYTACSIDAPSTVKSLCGVCFFSEGGIPPSCNKLPDGGGSNSDLSLVPDGGKDSGTDQH